jgi:hypothetical protein
MTSPDVLRTILKSQLHAALAMLRDGIEKCPDELWYDASRGNAFWQIAYHTVFFAHMYLHRDLEAFQPWERHYADAQHADGLPGKIDPDSPLPVLPPPYSRADVLEYWQVCDDMVDPSIDTVDLHRDECGFHWYQLTKLEHQLVNIRHIQHHAAQLADRLRASENIGMRWIGARRP